MISLKSLLLESIIYEKNAWLSPSGEFTPIHSYGGHYRTAKAIIEKNKYNVQDSHDPFHILWKLGYMRVVSIEDDMMVCNPNAFPNPKQKEKLINLAKDTGMHSIYYDNTDKHNLIWSTNNQLEESEKIITEHINDYSWLGPDGKFYPTNDHEYTAKQILRKLQLSQMDKDGIEYIPYEIMYKLGYMRIASVKKGILYATNKVKEPTTTQIRVLIDFGIENGFDSVVYISNSGHKTLWDKNHTLE